MGESKTQKAAPYPPTDAQEILAIVTFRTLIDNEKVKLDIKERDKYPNIDGYIELVDELRIPIGKLEVQIRKLPADQQKIQCPISLFSYSETMLNPVLLIGVDTENKKAYWVHVEKDLIANSINGSEQKTKVIPFPSSNILDGENAKYIIDWKNIVDAYRVRIKEYDRLKDSYAKLSKRSNPALGIERKDFQDIHMFLDEINTLLEGNFSAVKRAFYPFAWKVGLAYFSYEENSVSYTLYPIPFDKNDVQIKEGDGLLREELWNEGLGITGHNVENPIRVRPKKYAIEIVESNTLRLLKNRLLNHYEDEFLAREFIFAFIDRYFQQVGLEKKDIYSVDEIEKAFHQLLPAGIDERARATAEITMGHYRVPFGVFQRFLSFLKSKASEEISRVYIQKDFSRLQKGGLVYHLFSPEAIETNLKMFFVNLPVVYENIVSRNFPNIAHELPLFDDTSRAMVFFEAKEKYETLSDAPTIESFYLKSEDQHGLEIEVYRAEEKERFSNLSRDSWRKDIEIDDKKYNLVSWSQGILDFIYDELPMFNSVYKILEENLKHYFSNLREQQ